MKNKKHLPIYGVGPIYGFSIIVLTIVGIVMSCFEIINYGKFVENKIPFFIIGILILAYGFSVWFRGAFKIDKYITANQLCTEGIYAIVRNPCYSGIMLMCTGAIFIANNVFLLILPFLYWIFMTLLIKNTEEKWLYNIYGKEYLDYCKKVNRCIPWFKG
ncbi:methyltransferase family protein [Clostridium sp. LCP25S3_F10]|uniref:methyltransferase family protein n=1 Tax=Clostridium sp. LCP25S3_F10 TaxID=3438750 RepID=UPI003F8E3A3B